MLGRVPAFPIFSFQKRFRRSESCSINKEDDIDSLELSKRTSAPAPPKSGNFDFDRPRRLISTSPKPFKRWSGSKMGLEVIYIVRHGYRSNWTVDPSTGSYSSTVRTPTGIPSDPALASYGVRQSEQLATHLLNLDPPADIIYSSPYYRCLQTLVPFTNQLAEKLAEKHAGVEVWVEPGVGEFYGLADFEHPSPATIDILRQHFDNLHASSTGPILVPDKKGEGITQLHNRVAYVLDRLIKRCEADPTQPKAILICTHAAAVIAIGRALTGRMPEDVGEEDFQCFTCGVSKFRRRRSRGEAGEHVEGEESEDWDPHHPAKIPDVDWRDGKGVAGGWDCEENSDCSFLENGEERGWNFYMEQQRLQKLREDFETVDAVKVLSLSPKKDAEEGNKEHNSSGFA